MKETTYTAEQDAQIAELENLIYLACHAPWNLTCHEANVLDVFVTLLGQDAQIDELKRLIYLACHAPDNLTWDEANLVDDIVALLGQDA